MNARKVLLLILDGFGIGENNDSNAIFKARTPNLDYIFKSNPTIKLHASGVHVGLPNGQMGNSEVGHMNIGAGRIVYQDLTFINKEISDGSFYENDSLLEVINYVKSNGTALHVMGLLSDGGIHSHIEHFYALLQLAKKHNLNKVCFHIWTDGRDTLPKSALNYIIKLQESIDNIGIGTIDTICGRFYAMDRDKHWDRTYKAYNAIANADGIPYTSPSLYVTDCYNNNMTDEFIVPGVRSGYLGIQEKDAVLCLNFRPDRVRQITRMFVTDLSECINIKRAKIGKYCCFTRYDDTIKNVLVAFKPRILKNTLGECISKCGLKQLRIAETEKYAHVTFFFNGGIEKPYENEERIIVASPNVRTYDLKPEMSIYEVTNKTIENIKKNEYDFIIVNFANPDMVGHTGNLGATIKSIEVVDECVAKIVDAMNEANGVTIITADHGNAEKMRDEKGIPFTAHTSNLVPCCIVGEKYKFGIQNSICDIAAVILDILGLPIPNEMKKVDEI